MFSDFEPFFKNLLDLSIPFLNSLSFIIKFFIIISRTLRLHSRDTINLDLAGDINVDNKWGLFMIFSVKWLYPSTVADSKVTKGP